MGFSDALASMFGFGPSQQAAQSVNVARAAQVAQLQQEYQRALADPNSGIGLSPAMQQMQENELGNQVRGQMSNAGAGMSGASNDAVQKAIVDYRIKQMAMHMQHLDALRMGMVQASNPQTQQPSVPQQMASYGAGRMMQGFGNELFGAPYANPYGPQQNTGQGGVNPPGSAQPNTVSGGMGVAPTSQASGI